MHFLRRNKYFLCSLGVLVFASVMILRQITEAASAHVQRREEFLLLNEQGNTNLAPMRYQMLIQELPKLSDRLLSEDLQRTRMVIDPDAPDAGSLVY